MDERDYLLTASVHGHINDIIDYQPLRNDVTMSSFVEEDSGIFCSPRVLQSDPTVSLSYWIGHLLSNKVLTGRDLLLKQLLNEAEFEECPPSVAAQAMATVPSSVTKPPRIAHVPIPPQFSPDFLRTSTPKLNRISSQRKRKVAALETTTTTSDVAQSLLEVSRRLDSLLSRSREMSRDLRTVRQDLDDVEQNLIKTSDECKKTRQKFQNLNDNIRQPEVEQEKTIFDGRQSCRKSSLSKILLSGCQTLSTIDCPTFCFHSQEDDLNDEDDLWMNSSTKLSKLCRSKKPREDLGERNKSTDKLLPTDDPVNTCSTSDHPIYTCSTSDHPVSTCSTTDQPVYTLTTDQPVYTCSRPESPVRTIDNLKPLSGDAIHLRSSLIELVNYFDLEDVDDLDFLFPSSSSSCFDAKKRVTLRKAWNRDHRDADLNLIV